MAKLDNLMAHPALKGVATQGCIDVNRKTALKGVVAHSHWQRDQYRGWICLISRQHFNATTICHELAHIISKDPDHPSDGPGLGLKWAKTVRALGGRVERRYLVIKPLRSIRRGVAH